MNEAANSNRQDREKSNRNSDAVAGITGQEPKLSLAFVVTACFSVIKV